MKVNTNIFNESQEDAEYNRFLQLKLFSDAIHDHQPYSDVAECFTDVKITEYEYIKVLNDFFFTNNPNIITDFMKLKGYADETN